LPTWGSPGRARSRAPEKRSALGWLGRGRFRSWGPFLREGPCRAVWVRRLRRNPRTRGPLPRRQLSTSFASTAVRRSTRRINSPSRAAGFLSISPSLFSQGDQHPRQDPFRLGEESIGWLVKRLALAEHRGLPGHQDVSRMSDGRPGTRRLRGELSLREFSDLLCPLESLMRRGRLLLMFPSRRDIFRHESFEAATTPV
jgi:hypothetical protein